MSDPTHATPGQSSDVVFRMLAPVFMYEVQGATFFDHAGQFNNVKFKVTLQPYNHRRDFDEITESADIHSRETLQQRGIHKSDQFWHGPEPYILVMDVTHPAGSIQVNTAGCTQECWTIEDAVTDALRLHSSRGLPGHETYTFRSPPIESGFDDSLTQRIWAFAGFRPLRLRDLPSFSGSGPFVAVGPDRQSRC